MSDHNVSGAVRAFFLGLCYMFSFKVVRKVGKPKFSKS